MAERTSHNTILRFDHVILPPRAPGIIAFALALQRPLSLKQPSFRLDLAQGIHRQSDLIRCQSGQDHPLNFRIDQESPHLLASWLSVGAVVVRRPIWVMPDVLSCVLGCIVTATRKFGGMRSIASTAAPTLISGQGHCAGQLLRRFPAPAGGLAQLGTVRLDELPRLA